MNNIVIYELYSDIEEFFDDEEGEWLCYLLDEVYFENVDRLFVVSNLDVEVDNIMKFLNLDISSSIKEDGQVYEGGLVYEISNIIFGNRDVIEEGKEYFYDLFQWMFVMNYSNLQFMLRFIYFIRYIRVDIDWYRF